jgi:hypothetical protein
MPKEDATARVDRVLLLIADDVTVLRRPIADVELDRKSGALMERESQVPASARRVVHVRNEREKPRPDARGKGVLFGRSFRRDPGEYSAHLRRDELGAGALLGLHGA